MAASSHLTQHSTCVCSHTRRTRQPGMPLVPQRCSRLASTAQHEPSTASTTQQPMHAVQRCATSCRPPAYDDSGPSAYSAPHEYSRLTTCSEASTSGSGALLRLPTMAVSMVLAQQAAAALHPGAAEAGEEMSGTAVELFRQFLDQIQALGPWGPVIFVVTVALAEMIPLFPTQPLSLASGLLFGPIKGAVLILVGVTLAAFNAYTISRGVGRTLAERVINAEMSEEDADGAVAQQIAKVQRAIESGGFFKQLTAVTLLRLTPVVPFSASNYILGLTPVQLPALLGGTVAGMSIWALLYASLGAASRKLLDEGTDLEVLLADLGHKASKYTEDVAIGALVLGVIVLVYYGVTTYGRPAITASLDEESAFDSLDSKEEALQRK